MTRAKRVELAYEALHKALGEYRDLVVGGLCYARSKKKRIPYENALYGVDATFSALPRAKVQFPAKRGKKR